jgi:hypothetical protein
MSQYCYRVYKVFTDGDGTKQFFGPLVTTDRAQAELHFLGLQVTPVCAHAEEACKYAEDEDVIAETWIMDPIKKYPNKVGNGFLGGRPTRNQLQLFDAVSFIARVVQKLEIPIGAEDERHMRAAAKFNEAVQVLKDSPILASFDEWRKEGMGMGMDLEGSEEE